MEVAKCSNCSQALLYPDGALRCFDGHLATKPCAEHSFGYPTIHRPDFQKKKPEIVKQKAAVTKTVSKKKVKSMSQGRML